MGEILKTYDGGFSNLEELIKKLHLKIIDPQSLPDELLLQFAQKLSELISADPHMLPVCPEEIIARAEEGLSLMIVGDNRPVGYGKFYPWQRER